MTGRSARHCLVEADLPRDGKVLALDPRGTPDIAAIAALVVRDICGNPVLDFRQRSIYADSRACSPAKQPT